MVYAYDGKAMQTVDAILYDGFGNRVSITQAGTTITYSYDARQRVVSASNGETWQYDQLGNNTVHRAANGDTTTIKLYRQRERQLWCKSQPSVSSGASHSGSECPRQPGWHATAVRRFV
jgi:YD repeat-containing protein